MSTNPYGKRKRVHEEEEKKLPGPFKRPNIDQGRTFTSFDKQILSYYAKLAPRYQLKIFPDRLIKTIKKLIKWGNTSLLEEMEREDFKLSTLIERMSQIKKNDFSITCTKFKAPLVKAMLNNYLIAMPQKEDPWLPPYICLEAIKRALKKIPKDNGNIPRGIVVSFPSELNSKQRVVGVLVSDSQVLLMKITRLLGKGRYGEVFETVDAFNKSRVVKISQSNNKESLFRECNTLHFIHEKKIITGIQLPPKALVRLGRSNNAEVAMFEDQYDGSLNNILGANRSFFTDCGEVFEAFLPLFEGLMHATHEDGFVHRDIKMDNILVKKEGDKVKLDLADWGRSQQILLSEPEAYETESLALGIEGLIKKWREEDSQSELKNSIRGNAQQLLECYQSIYRSRDIQQLGKIFEKTLETTIKADRTSSEWIILFGLSNPKFENDPAVQLVVDLLLGMTTNHYVPNEMAGLYFLFPKRLNMIECYEKLKEIVRVY